MAENAGEKLLNDLNEFLSDDAKDSASSNADDSALPFESLDDYSTDPIGFGDMSLKMLTAVDFVFDLAVKYNRRSSKYLRTCAHLERGIKYLAGCVRTKLALEARNFTFPELGQLSTEKLYRMASFHFRKIDRALSEYIAEKQDVDDALLDMQFRYFSLLERLRATEVKIHNYRLNSTFGKENYDPVVHGLAFSPKSWNRTYNEEHYEPVAFRRAPAFPMIKGYGVSSSESQAADSPALPEGSDQCSVTGDQCSAVSDQCSVAGDQCSVTGGSSSSAGALEKESLLTPHSSFLTESDSSLLTEHNSPFQTESDSSPHIPLITEPAAYLDTLMNGLKRGREAGGEEGTVIFTDEEMHQLVNDPVFCGCEPEMAASLRQILAEMDTG